MKSIFTFIVLSIYSFVAFSQTTVTYEGIVKDNQNQAVAFATISLLNIDSNIIASTQSNLEGKYSIATTKNNIKYIKASYIGFDNFIQKVTNTNTNLNIVLKQNSKNLKSIDVVSEKKAIQNSIDKIVINADKLAVAAGGNATDVLKSAPAVTVDFEGNVALRGNKNVAILINGVPANRFGSDVTKVLQAMNASDIVSIYLINNMNSNVLGNEVRSEKNALSFVGGIRLDNVHNSNIKCNAVIGNARDSVAPFKPIIAMHVQDSRRNFIDCNHTDSAHYGIRFFSNCYTLNGIAGNEFANSYDQFVLMTNGIIGNQNFRITSGISQNLDNQWQGWYVRNTYTINSYGGSYNFMVRTTGLPYKPIVNLRNSTSFSIISPTTFTLSPLIDCNPISCSGIRFRMAGGEGENSEKVTFLEDAATESIPAEISEEENTYLLKKDAYLELKKDTTLLDSSEILDIFYAEMKASNIELMDKIQHLMEQENIEEAKLQNQTFVTTNKIEENEKMMNEILLNADNIDINEVWQVVMDIANQCPISGGEAVYDARAWLMTYDKNLDWLDDDRCIKGIDYRIANPNPTTEEIKVLLFPNPSNEYINIWMKDYMISDEETIYIEIRDMLGRTILNTSDKMQSSIMKLETSKWASGNYILKISTSKGFETKTKINVLH
jgi:hypothetical protein